MARGQSLNFRILDYNFLAIYVSEFHDLTFSTMSGAQSSILPTIVASGKDKLEARLLALCMNNGVPVPMMDKLGNSGLTSIPLMKNTLIDKDDWRRTLAQPPFDLSGTDFNTKLEIGKLISVYESCCASNEVEVKANVERIRQNLPPEVNVQEIHQARRLYETAEDVELTEVMLPSKGYYERMILQVETAFEEVPLTRVSNLSQEDVNISPNSMNMDLSTGFCRTSRVEKEFFTPMPSTPEELRARMKTYAMCWTFMRMKFPSKAQLTTATVDVTDKYVDWLFGPKCWGMVTLDSDMKPKATPTIVHVLQYDRQIRKKQMSLMNAGHDFKVALLAARKDDELRQQHFLHPVSLDLHTDECRRCTAPGIRETYGMSVPKTTTQSALPTSATLSKGAIKKIKQEAKAAAERNLRQQMGIQSNGAQPMTAKAKKKAAAKARAQLALAAPTGALPITNGGVGDAIDLSGAYGKGKSKGKGGK